MGSSNSNYLLNWCNRHRLAIAPNTEVFFVNERALIRPEYIINNKIYIDLVEGEPSEKYITYCQEFSRSFGTIILISYDTLPEIQNITKEEFELNYNINF